MPQVPTGIITQLAHPPYGVLTRETGPTLTTGLYQLQRIRGPVNVDAFGVSFSFFTIPAAFGHTDRTDRDYELPIAEWSAAYTMLDGHVVTSPPQVVRHEGDLYWFDQLLPLHVNVWVQVGCAVTVFWLLAL